MLTRMPTAATTVTSEQMMSSMTLLGLRNVSKKSRMTEAGLHAITSVPLFRSYMRAWPVTPPRDCTRMAETASLSARSAWSLMVLSGVRS